MTLVQVKVKKWGNSMAVILPKEFIDKTNLKEHEKVYLDVIRKADLSSVFGTLKFKESAQELKDIVRKGWN